MNSDDILSDMLKNVLIHNYFSIIVSSILVPKWVAPGPTCTKTLSPCFKSTTEIGFPFDLINRIVSAF
ncbi:MAG: hypothetical protein P8Y97_10780 [Candidatus Lokiarchaeota archaeon]